MLLHFNRKYHLDCYDFVSISINAMVNKKFRFINRLLKKYLFTFFHRFFFLVSSCLKITGCVFVIWLIYLLEKTASPIANTLLFRSDPGVF